MPTYYVYLKTGAHEGSSDGALVNTIPLLVTSVAISTSKQIPALPIPFSGAVTGESITAALDIGMATKSLSLSGFLMEGEIERHGKGRLTMTAHEIAQILHSSTDSTGIANHQSIQELVFLIPSKVDETYTQRSSPSEINIPWTFKARGAANELDNLLVPFPSTFPTNENSAGVTGFIRSFSTTFTSDTVEVEFSLDFEVAVVRP